jgi:hypothetical protein
MDSPFSFTAGNRCEPEMQPAEIATHFPTAKQLEVTGEAGSDNRLDRQERWL